MKNGQIFDRIFFGKLVTLPAQLEEGMAKYAEPVPIPGDSPDLEHKVLYALSRVP